MLQKLDDVSCGKKVWCGEVKPLAHPSVYSRELCSVVRDSSYAVKRDHPLLLVGCFLNLLLREMEHIVDTHQRAEYRTKAEEFARKLARNQKEHLDRFGASKPSVGLKAMISEPDSAVQVHDEAIYSRNNEVGTKGNVGGKKRPFDLHECTNSVPNDPQTLDEVSMYNML